MKRSLCFILAISILCLTLVSCSENKGMSDVSQTYKDRTVEEALYVPVKRQKQEVISEEGFYMSGSGTYVTPETVEKYPKLTNLPTVYIELEGGDLSSVRHGVYSKVKITLADEYVIDSVYERSAQIKGRGNWSWSFAQKPYTVKLDEGADLLGMGKAKKWVLVTVHSDKTMMHNYMTQKLAKNMGLYGTCDNEYVDVVCNGKYAGTYVLTEKIQLHENRVALKDDKGALFEIEMVYRHTCDNCVVLYEDPSDRSKSIHMRMIEYGKWDLENLSPSQLEWMNYFMPLLQEHINTVSALMQEGDLLELENYIDVDSFINWYLLNELTRNFDSAFVTSCYCFLDEDNILYMGPVWDYDTCYGIQDAAYDSSRIQDAPWFAYLMNNCEKFKELVDARWTELRKDNGVIEKFYNSIRDVSNYISRSEILQHTLYPDSELLNVPYEEALEYFEAWLSNRLIWMDENFLIS